MKMNDRDILMVSLYVLNRAINDLYAVNESLSFVKFKNKSNNQHKDAINIMLKNYIRNLNDVIRDVERNVEIWADGY